CKQNLEVALEFVRNAQNHLHSMIFNLDIDKSATAKFHESEHSFHVIMYQYVKEIIDKCNNKFNIKQINNMSGYYYEYGPKAINYFEGNEDKFGQFEYY